MPPDDYQDIEEDEVTMYKAKGLSVRDYMLRCLSTVLAITTALFAVIMILLYQQMDEEVIEEFMTIDQFPPPAKPKPGPGLISTSVCQVPDWPIFDNETFEFFEDMHGEKSFCNFTPPFVIRRVNYTWIDIDYPTGNHSWICLGQDIKRSKTDRIDFGKQTGFMGRLTDFTVNSTNIAGSFPEWQAAYVSCVNLAINTSYDRVIPLVQPRTPLPVKSTSPNILLLGIDSISRLQFNRHFVETRKLLINEDFITMVGYHKVGDNSFPNVLPILSGHHLNFFVDSTPDANHTWDHVPLINLEFQKRGYLTTHIEDMPYYGFFSYDSSGFKEQPTDYYLRPVNWAISMDIYFQSCYQEKFECEHYYDYILDQLDAFKSRGNQSFFTFFHESTLTHFDHNNAGYLDRPLSAFLERVFAGDHHKNTVIILFSDHAIRQGEMLKTTSAIYETRLPFFSIYLPKKLTLNGRNIDQLKKALRINSHRLTSHFDLHATMMHLLTGQIPDSETAPFGRSLLEEIPENRTCPEAGIPPEFCLCNTFTVIPVDNHVRSNAMFIVDQINVKLANSPCIPLQLNSTRTAYKATSRDGTEHYQLIRFETEPNRGVFEAMLGWDKNEPKPKPKLRFLTRLNSYDHQSRCVGKHRELAIICMCIDANREKTVAKG